ncbi:hypothetical protein ACO0SA_002287 [Hanseniaspora valbyensis]|uniref:Cytochrome c oxidase subunit 8, mitochondrial n=1 Tax=Hanseniaspora valbyensis NRRL Y-1626 TaxID=766949 RepID=A0A1B7TJC7_9ASCO|nr:hypothetical protein HANVADRAFT_51303 [Hanseniaspora valbyensis NRRL Y-1626]
MFLKQLAQQRRQFSIQSKKLHSYGEADKLYSNLPFKVKNRLIPYKFVHYTFFIVGYSIPFAVTYLQLKRSGSI